MGVPIDPGFGVNGNTLKIILMEVYVPINPTYRVNRNFKWVLKKNTNIAVTVHASYTLKWGRSHSPRGTLRGEWEHKKIFRSQFFQTD